MKSFSIEGKTEAKDGSQMQELMSDRFKMMVNGHSYLVYPNLRSIILTQQKFKNPTTLEHFNEANTTMTVARQVVATEFLDKVCTEVSKKKKAMTKQQVEESLKKAIASYSSNIKKC